MTQADIQLHYDQICEGAVAAVEKVVRLENNLSQLLDHIEKEQDKIVQYLKVYDVGIKELEATDKEAQKMINCINKLRKKHRYLQH